MHDISWGTKGLESAGHEKVEDKEVSGGDTITSGDTVQNEANRIHDLVMKERKKRLTKGEADDKDDVEREFRAFRSTMVIVWIFSNVMFCFAIIGAAIPVNEYLPFLFLSAGVFTGMRVIGSIYFLMDRLWRLYFVNPLSRCCCTKENQIDYGDPRAALLNSNVLTYERVDHDDPAFSDDDYE